MLWGLPAAADPLPSRMALPGTVPGDDQAVADPSHLPWPQPPPLAPATSPDLLDLAEEVAGAGGTMATAPGVPGTVLSTGFDTVPMDFDVTDSLEIVPPRVW